MFPCCKDNGAPLIRGRQRGRELAKVFVPKALEMERLFFVWREGKGGLSLILSSPEVGRGAFSIQRCYSHQLVGMGLLKCLSKEGFGSQPVFVIHNFFSLG